MGALAARRAGRWQDSLITTLALIFYATPLFWIALMSQILFSLKLGLVPNVGYETIGAGYTGLARALDIVSHLVLPALTLGLFFTALYARMMRASMLEVAGADFVKTARAKGLSPGVVSRRHVARNAILPVVTLAGLQAGQLVGGAVLTETVFAWPGIGRLMFDALVQRDYSVLLGVFFVSSAMVVGFNILTDLVYRLADPRIEAVS
jgi:peptide/nickel transport system permease protein